MATLLKRYKDLPETIQRKVKSGVLIPVVSVGRVEDGRTTIQQQVDPDGDPVVRFIPKAQLGGFTEFGWQKMAIPNEPIVKKEESEPVQAIDEGEDAPKVGRRRKKDE